MCIDITCFYLIVKGWVTTERNKENNSNDHEHMLSVDCEMVLCEDGEREVVRVCIVNSDCKVMDQEVHVIT